MQIPTKSLSFACPTVMAQFLKTKMLQRIKDGSIRDIAGMRFNNVTVFSPKGFVCEAWAQFTGCGDWIAGNFRYRVPGGSYAFSHDMVPTRLVDDFAPIKDGGCPLRYHMLYGSNKISAYKDLFTRMEDFKLIIPENLKPEEEVIFSTSFKWKIESNVTKEGVTYKMIKYLNAPTVTAVRHLFNTQNPDAVITDIHPITSTL